MEPRHEEDMKTQADETVQRVAGFRGDYDGTTTPTDSRIRRSVYKYTKPYVREEAKVCRNALCSCGSGKKYKRCCINKK